MSGGRFLFCSAQLTAPPKGRSSQCVSNYELYTGGTSVKTGSFAGRIQSSTAVLTIDDLAFNWLLSLVQKGALCFFFLSYSWRP